ncbi:DUF4198 domain-containing protein [Paraglaciecola sp. 2405UD69-4]|uniref:DUF4198 domain-containing protein n=1 Tax=Paraglaciecola sp. 2405UD69-4 TaxID=3391836 RepID=UPI0039C8FA28
MKRSISILLLGSLMATIPAANAHRAWIVPAATVLSGDEPWVTFDAAASNDIFHADHAPLRLDGVVVKAPNGKTVELLNSHTGKHRSTFDLQLKQDGTYKIERASSGLRARWKTEDGKRGSWPKRGQKANIKDFDKMVPKNAKDLVVSETSRRVETFVTSGTPSNQVFEPSNVGLELVPITHPNDLYSEETAEFKLLIDGEVAVGAKVEVLAGGMRYRDSQDQITATTDKEGKFSITWPSAGMYWMSASYEDDKASKPATKRQGGYSASFEVLPQ